MGYMKKLIHFCLMLTVVWGALCGCRSSISQPGENAEEATVMENPVNTNEIESLAGYLRVNQLGYLPEAVKTAYFLGNDELESSHLKLMSKEGNILPFTDFLVEDQGRYGEFAHLYRINFSAFKEKGSYMLSIGHLVSYPFQIADDLYAPLIPQSLSFMESQRCGVEIEGVHAACHLQDGVAANGEMAGQVIDAVGGWHDAGDYIKFSITSGYSTYLLVHAAEVLGSGENAEMVFHEAEIGLEWLSKLWDEQHGILYYQVSDEADHEDWRMPEEDQLNPRAVYACDEGKGANIAGKSAAVMALASRLYGEPTSNWYDEGLAATYLSRAISLYEFGLQNQDAQPSNPADFYTETTWKDDMALAAVELFEATGQEQYSEDALNWMQAIGRGSGFSWGEMGAAAVYKAARYEMIPVEEALGYLESDLQLAAELSEQQSFSVAIPAFHWGSAETMGDIVLEAMWYNDLKPDGGVESMAMRQMDYIFGANPWGVSWVSGIGSQWPKNPHHQIADLTNSDLPGFWDEGAVPLEVFTSSGPEALLEEDEYAEFQTEDAVYHDDTEDWVTNEPTITMNATGIAICSWLAK
jgi:hypothetical protein